jgi:prevent-host-death family protein
MGVVNVREAKTNLSKLLERVARGEEIIIAKRGRPVARLVRLCREPRRPGRLRGRIRFGPGFEEPLPGEILDALQGDGD